MRNFSLLTDVTILFARCIRKINVTLTNVRCVQNEFSSDDAFSPLSRTPRGSLSVIDIDAPQPPRTRNSITVKVRSKFGLHRYQLAMVRMLINSSKYSTSSVGFCRLIFSNVD